MLQLTLSIDQVTRNRINELSVLLLVIHKVLTNISIKYKYTFQLNIKEGKNEYKFRLVKVWYKVK